MTFESQLALLVQEYYHLTGRWKALPGEYDLNFRLDTDQDSYVVKLLQARPDLLGLTDLQYIMGQRLQGLPTPLRMPHLIPTKDGALTHEVVLEGKKYALRIFDWLDGRLWVDTRPHSPTLLQSAGAALAHIGLTLQGMDHPAAHRKLKWDVTNPDWAASKIPVIQDSVKQSLARQLHRNFEAIRTQLSHLPWGINYFDANDYNVLVSSDFQNPQVTGMIDYGDVLWNPVISDLVLGITYLTLDQEDPLEASVHLLRGYHEVRPLNENELSCLYGLVCSRLLIIVVNAAINQEEEPENAYLQVSYAPAWKAINAWLQHHSEFIYYTMRWAAGLEPCPARLHFDQWLATGPTFFPITEIDPKRAMWIDLGLTNPLLGPAEDLRDLPYFERTIQRLLDNGEATCGYGGYLETRIMYTSPEFIVTTNQGLAWRTVHLGLDLWDKAGTPVYAPWPGVVYQVKNNAGERNYGPTVILEHKINDQLTFYTLYGHLAKQVLENLLVGQSIAAGEQLAAFGDPEENGGWPPHLHFQILLHPLGSTGDFPGVSRPDQMMLWASLCPDPGQLSGYSFIYSHQKAPSIADLLQRRQKRLSPNLSVSYQPDPLNMVRGDGTYLIDQSGRKYLDTVNNVAHVGHENPRVVRAGQLQMGLLNTNTRYLHPAIIELAEQLTTFLPDSLQVCFFVNSGSEANELAYRLAKAATGQRGMAVMEMGYHGNTNICIDLSSYKFDRKGGTGAPAYIRVVKAPDMYRCTGHTAESELIRQAEKQLNELHQSPFGLAGMIVEHIMSCAGQVPIPSTIAQAYARMVRSLGGVYIADEVQTGLGRVGKAFWAFELSGVIPDIVTIGKPFGNGHPLAAVVTTPAIAQAFHNGMEYFNTFGGNPVSSVIGKEVLTVIREDELQLNALQRGEQMKRGLRELQKETGIIGDVRGEGLFLGFELVTNPDLKTPATAQAAYLARRARTMGLLLSTDGPFDNVIKIKPPMCITEGQMEYALHVLRLLFKEDMLKYID